MSSQASLVILLVALAVAWAGKKCCQDVGCFDNSSGPMSSFPEPMCPEEIGIKYYLLTQKNAEFDDAVEFTSDNIPSLFDPKKLTIWTSHGWMGESDMEWMHELTSALLQRLDANVISVDWKEGSSQVYYPKAASTSQTAGAAIALTMQALVDQHGVSYDDMWCVGFSLGAHVCGHAGMRANGQLARVTGLDPAGPWFSGGDVRNGINPSSARFVDVVHTDGAGIISYYGIMERRGHADFYPNGGRDQPGCYFGRRKRALPATLQNLGHDVGYHCVTANNDLDVVNCPYNTFVGCSHYRAVYFFIESISEQGCHVATQKCTDENKLPQSCSPVEHTEMGLMADKNYHKNGIFYLETGKSKPYCRYA